MTRVENQNMIAELARLRECEREEAETSAEYIVGGSLTEAIGGAGAVVLAILGLTGIMPTYMLGIGTLVVGIAFLCEGVAAMARYRKLVHETGSVDRASAELGSGLSADFIG